MNDKEEQIEVLLEILLESKLLVVIRELDW